MIIGYNGIGPLARMMSGLLTDSWQVADTERKKTVKTRTVRRLIFRFLPGQRSHSDSQPSSEELPDLSIIIRKEYHFIKFVFVFGNYGAIFLVILKPYERAPLRIERAMFARQTLNLITFGNNSFHSYIPE